jgi:hypothetical protein
MGDAVILMWMENAEFLDENTIRNEGIIHRSAIIYTAKFLLRIETHNRYILTWFGNLSDV